jgi:hypothetical protein
MSSGIDPEIQELAQRIVSEIETTSSEDLASSDEIVRILHLTDLRHAKKVLQHMDSVSSRSERNVGKKAVVEALLLSTWLQRLYFVIRSLIMSVITGVLTFSVILYFGSLNVFSGLALGMLGFVVSLVVSRLFDPQIVNVTKTIVMFMNKHKVVRNFVLKHF